MTWEGKMSRVKHTFHGGIHPGGAKSLSKNEPIREYLPKGNLYYPLAQHIGAPAVPVVEKGDYVLSGPAVLFRRRSMLLCPVRSLVSPII